MLRNGSYSAWFRTPRGEGMGVVVLNDGKLSGGDTITAILAHTLRTAIILPLSLPPNAIRKA